MLNKKKNKITFNYYCGVDFDIYKININNNCNINIFQGNFYLNFFIKFIWLILPSCVFTEYFFYYLNLEGRYRLTQKAISSSLNVFKDSSIFKILFNYKNLIISNNFSIITNFYFFIKYFNHIVIYLNVNLFNFYIIFFISYRTLNSIYCFTIYNALLNINFKFINSLFNKLIYNFYFNDNISKNSKIINKINNLIYLQNK